jgi:hypothetical protein
MDATPQALRRSYTRRMIRACKKLLFLFFLCASACAHGQDPFDGGIAVSRSEGGEYRLANRAIEAKWIVEKNHFNSLSLTDRLDQRSLPVPSLFSLRFADGRIIRAQDLHFAAPPTVHALPADAGASRFSDRVGGKEFVGVLEDESGDLRVDLSLILRDGSSYLREVVTISAPHQNLVINDVRLIDLQLPEAQISGNGCRFADRRWQFLPWVRTSAIFKRQGRRRGHRRPKEDAALT